MASKPSTLTAPDTENAGEIVRAIRDFAGVTQAELASRLKYSSHSQVTQLEGRDEIKLGTLRSVVKALGLEMEIVFRRRR